jgi:Amt family ammonium transporter
MHDLAVEATKTEHDLRKALANNELFLCYQPIFSLAENRLEGFEALVRWNHPVTGVIVPDKFIPVAEESGIIIKLGEFVLKEAIYQLKKWHDLSDNYKKIFISINVSVKQFLQPDLAEYILELLAETQVDPTCIHIEITESLLAKKARAMAKKLSYLQENGLKIVLDDFGTGYSSLSYMQQFPIDNIKIDRSFIQNLGAEYDSKEIVKTIINLSKKLGFEVVAEGVERKDQLENLISMDCKRVQGFYFSKPLNIKDATDILKTYCK